jgi:Domain of unknown function (DUF4404)
MINSQPGADMSNERIRELLTQLRNELDNANVDHSTSSLMRKLAGDINGALGQSDAPINTLIDRARQLEANFAAKHAGAEGILRQIVDMLAKMGV